MGSMHGQLLVDQETLESIFAKKSLNAVHAEDPESNSGGRNSPESMIHLFTPKFRITLQRFWLPNWL